MEKIYLAITENNKPMRDGLAVLMKNNPKYELIHIAKDGLELIQKIEDRKTLPDIILMCIETPIVKGFEACKQIRTKYKEVSVIFLTSIISKSFMRNAILAGGNGYLSIDADISEVYEAIDEVYTKGFYFNDILNADFINQQIQNGYITHKFSNHALD